jgi:DNA-binding transcriptional ArsR family regulator
LAASPFRDQAASKLNLECSNNPNNRNYIVPDAGLQADFTVAMKPIIHPDRDTISLASVLYALGDPIRLKIVQKLAQEGEQVCGALNCSVPKSTLSHHFRILREAGVIHSRKSGTQYINTLRCDDLNSRFPQLLEAVLTALEANS